MSRTLIHDSGATKFYRLISGSVCVEQLCRIDVEGIDRAAWSAAIRDFCDRGLVLGADDRAIGTPFAIELTPALFSVSFVPLAGFREEECCTLLWSLEMQRRTGEHGERSFHIVRVGFQRPLF